MVVSVIELAVLVVDVVVAEEEEGHKWEKKTTRDNYAKPYLPNAYVKQSALQGSLGSSQ